MDRSEALETRRGKDGRSPFERFVERSYQIVSRAPFFYACLVLIAAWAVSLPLWSSLTKWELAIHTLTSVLSLLLLVILENANRRGEEAAQEKLNVLAEALAALMDAQAKTNPELVEAATELREAVGLEARH